MTLWSQNVQIPHNNKTCSHCSFQWYAFSVQCSVYSTILRMVWPFDVFQPDYFVSCVECWVWSSFAINFHFVKIIKTNPFPTIAMYLGSMIILVWHLFLCLSSSRALEWFELFCTIQMKCVFFWLNGNNQIKRRFFIQIKIEHTRKLPKNTFPYSEHIWIYKAYRFVNQLADEWVNMKWKMLSFSVFIHEIGKFFRLGSIQK